MAIDVPPADLAEMIAVRIRSALPIDGDLFVRQLQQQTGLSERTIRYHLWSWSSKRCPGTAQQLLREPIGTRTS